jgi:hypothetical protein
VGRATQAIKRALRPLLTPATSRYRDAREQLDGIDQRSQVINDQVSVVLQHLVELEGQLRVDANVLGEFSRASRRIVTQLEDRLDELAAVADATPGSTPVAAHVPGFPDVAAVVDALAGIDAPAPMVVSGTDAGGIALTLAALGHPVTLVGNAAATTHPLLTTVGTPVHQWAGPTVPVDVVIARSSLGIDDRLVDRARDWLEPGGRLVLALVAEPAATPGATPALDDERLDKALADWRVVTERAYVRGDDDAWTLVPGGRADVGWDSARSVLVLVAATRS